MLLAENAPQGGSQSQRSSAYWGNSTNGSKCNCPRESSTTMPLAIIGDR